MSKEQAPAKFVEDAKALGVAFNKLAKDWGYAMALNGVASIIAVAALQQPMPGHALMQFFGVCTDKLDAAVQASAKIQAAMKGTKL